MDKLELSKKLSSVQIEIDCDNTVNIFKEFSNLINNNKLTEEDIKNISNIYTGFNYSVYCIEELAEKLDIDF